MQERWHSIASLAQIISSLSATPPHRCDLLYAQPPPMNETREPTHPNDLPMALPQPTPLEALTPPSSPFHGDGDKNDDGHVDDHTGNQL
ncbi:hypothetical protein TIFTF001_032269 [Ficus carica]|uniref:Uncharacterized protein n=1 Tax=Ficus carica TaxID=3494 RepID=A0AA88DWX8_FICCA|nr:hypothetical protein TIFTF001_032269 [Ficus carica]